MNSFDGYYDMQKSFNYELVKSISTTTPNSPPPPIRKIYFVFTFNFEVSKWVFGEDDGDESRLIFQSTNPGIYYLVSMDFNRFSSTEETQKYMQESLSVMPINPNDLQNLVDFAMYEASKHSTDLCYSLSLHFNVLTEHEYIFLQEEVDDDYDIEEVRNNNIPTFSPMVSPKDSSIQVLNKVEAAECYDQNTDCSICLDKLFGCTYCQKVLIMLCSHVFHGSCIKNWLKVSHYCPLCRFEIPTTQ